MARTGLDYVIGGFGSLQDAFAQIAQIKQREDLLGLEKKKMEAAAEEARIEREYLERGTQGLQDAFGMPVGQEVAQGPPTADGALPMAGYTEADKQQAMLEAGLDMYMGGNAALGNKIVDQTLFPDPGQSKDKLLADLAKSRAETERINADTLNKRIANEQAKIKLSESMSFIGSKGNLANMLTAKANEAQSPTEKLQLTMAAESIKAAEDGGGLANILETQFPNVKGSSSAMEALLRQGMDPVDAYQTLQKIDTQNRLQLKKEGKIAERDFGHDREAWASILFGGKAFADLTPNEQRMANDKYLEQRIKEQQQKVGDMPLSAGNQDKLATYNYMIELAQKAQALATPELVGKLNAPFGRLKEQFGQADPQFTQLATTLDELVDAVARDRTGAVIGKDEVKFYGDLLGSVQTNPKTLQERLSSFVSRIESQRNNVVNLATTSASELKAQYSTTPARPTPPASTQQTTPAPAAPAAPDTSTGVPPVEPSGRITEPLAPEQVKKGEQLLQGLGIPLQ